jgi:hypothetical protein
MAQIGNTTVLPSMTLGIPLAQASGGTGGNYPVYQMVLGTAQATTSGTSIDFTGIPSWVKRITVMLNGVSITAAVNVSIQVGNGSNITTGYTANYMWGSTATLSTSSTITTGFTIPVQSASDNIIGRLVIDKISDFNYVASGNFFMNSANQATVAGSISLGSVLDRIRISINSSTFDAGSVNIMYEGYL